MKRNYLIRLKQFQLIAVVVGWKAKQPLLLPQGPRNICKYNSGQKAGAGFKSLN